MIQMTKENFDILYEEHLKYLAGVEKTSPADFTDCLFESMKLAGMNFSGAIMRNCKFVNCDARGCNFNGIDGSGISMVGCDCNGSSFDEAKFINGSFKKCTMMNCTFALTRMKSVSIFDSMFTESKFFETRFVNTVMNTCYLYRAEFLRCKFRKAMRVYSCYFDKFEMKEPDGFENIYVCDCVNDGCDEETVNGLRIFRDKGCKKEYMKHLWNNMIRKLGIGMFLFKL